MTTQELQQRTAQLFTRFSDEAWTRAQREQTRFFQISIVCVACVFLSSFLGNAFVTLGVFFFAIAALLVLQRMNLICFLYQRVGQAQTIASIFMGTVEENDLLRKFIVESITSLQRWFSEIQDGTYLQTQIPTGPKIPWLLREKPLEEPFFSVEFCTELDLLTRETQTWMIPPI